MELTLTLKEVLYLKFLAKKSGLEIIIRKDGIAINKKPGKTLTEKQIANAKKLFLWLKAKYAESTKNG